jgi:oligopeptidase B
MRNKGMPPRSTQRDGRVRAAVFAIIAASLLVPVSLEAAGLVAEPPIAPVIPVADTLFGDVRIDDYAWLRDRTDPEVISYLEAENAYTDVMMKHTEALQESLYKEMVGRIKETDLTVPYREGAYYYYTRTEEGEQYPIYCRKLGSLDAPEQIMLDQNVLSKGHGFYEIGNMAVSADGALLAFVADTTGAEIFTLHVKNLLSGEELGDVIGDVDYGLEWANDNSTLFYTTADDAERPYKLWRHKLGTPRSDDVLVYTEPDSRFWLDISKTRSNAYLILSLERRTSTEQWFLDADTPDADFKLIEPRTEGLEYYVSHHGDDFYVLMNIDGRNYEVSKTPVAAPSRESWVSVVPYRPDVNVESLECFRDYVVLLEREKGLRGIRVMDLANGTEHHVTFPEPTYAIYLGQNRVYDTDLLRFHYTSLVSPQSVYDYNMATRDRELLKMQEVVGGYDPALYKSERIVATAADGTEVPISLVYRRDLFKEEGNPLFVYGYGAYGATMDPWFSIPRLSLLDRGFVYAIAHVRGGGDLGEQWYDDGKLLNKKNTFTDFIACVDALTWKGYGTPDQVVISGESAGGMLIGAVLNIRPDIAAVALAGVPFVDVLNTMLDPSLPLTVGEYEEWGNPHEEKYYRYIKSYSPYDNVGHYEYPDILVTGSLNDQRVQYWEPAKWTAKLRVQKTGDEVLLLKMNMGAGHGGASGRYDRLREMALQYAFVLDRLNLVAWPLGDALDVKQPNW